MRLRYLIILFLVLSLVVAFVLFRNKINEGRTEVAQYRDLGYKVAATGKVEGWKEAYIGYKNPGKIEAIKVREGDTIKKGSVLVVMDKGDLIYRLEEAQVSLKQTELDLEKYSSLYERGFVSKRELELIDTGHKKAMANVGAIKKLIEESVITAPFDCTVVKKYKEVGETTGPFSTPGPIMKVADISRLKVRAEVEESDIGKIKIGQTADITLDAYPGEVFNGKVISIGYAVGKRKILPDDPAAPVDVKVIECIIEMPPTELLKVGMTVEVKINAPIKKNALSVSHKAVMRDNEGEFVQVFAEDKIKKVRIKTGLKDDFYVEIIEGLKEGDRIVIK